MSVRVLHVVGRMHRGGVETWLMQLLRNCDRARIRMDFLVNGLEPGDYDEEILSYGASVIPVVHPRRPVAFTRNFWRILREHGPYDVVHSHVHHSTGLILAIAKAGGVPIRIAHSHSDTMALDRAASLARRTYVMAMQSAINAFATSGLAASDLAARALFGRRWQERPDRKVLRCGLDYSHFGRSFDRAAVRKSIGLTSDSFVVGHVGRFDPAKNHSFLLDVAAAVTRRSGSAHFVLVGDGPERPRIESKISALGLGRRVHCLGVRSDIPALLRSFDIFCLPSLREGLPLVGLEAQAAGLPIALSDTITRELAVVPELFTWLSLDESPEQWAEALFAATLSSRIGKGEALERMKASDFSVEHTLSALSREYARA